MEGACKREIPGSGGNHYFKSSAGLASMLSAVLPDSLHKLQLFACTSVAVSFKSNEGHGLKRCLYPSGGVPGPRWCLRTLPRGGCPLRVLFPTDGRGLIIRGNLVVQNTLGVPKAFSLWKSRQGRHPALLERFLLPRRGKCCLLLSLLKLWSVVKACLKAGYALQRYPGLIRDFKGV